MITDRLTKFLNSLTFKKHKNKELIFSSLALASVALGIWVLSFTLEPKVSLAATRPNIILIMTDDLDSGALDKMLSSGLMPNLKKYIADKGVTFNQSYVIDARGCPSRNSFYKGLYFHNHGLADGRCGVSVFDDSSTLATSLHNGGYQTALIGKYMDGYGFTDINRDTVIDEQDALYIPPGWDNWQAFALNPKGWTPPPGTLTVWWDHPNMYNYTINDNRNLVTYGTSSQAYQTDVLAQRASNYITTVGSSSPFFLLLTPTAPHVEVFPDPTTIDTAQDAWKWDIRPAPRHIGLVNFDLPGTPSFNESDVSDKPLWVQEKPLLNAEEDIPNLTNQYRNRLASLMAVDDLIGKVANTVNASGNASNTILMFTSDNGWFYGEHRLPSKLAVYEEAIRVPLLIGGGQEPKASNALVNNLDLYPTIAELAEVTPDGPIDGTSLVPLLSNPALKWRKRFLVESWQVAGKNADPGLFDIPTFHAVKTSSVAPNVPNQVFARYIDGAIDFYDLNIDPFELENLNLDSSASRVQQRLIHGQWLINLQNCGNGTCQQFEFR